MRNEADMVNNVSKRMRALVKEATPGRWTCDVTDQGGAGHGAYVAVQDGYQTIARVCCYDRNLDSLPYEANARLIAAAPAMLAALRRLAESFGWPADHPVCILISQATGDAP